MGWWSGASSRKGHVGFGTTRMGGTLNSDDFRKFAGEVVAEATLMKH